MMKRLLLSLTLIIGISHAETTDNLINQNGELDHNSTYYETSSEQTYVIPEDADWSNPTQIDWSVDVRSYDNAVGCYSNCIDDTASIYLEYKNANGTNVATDTTYANITLDWDGGGWSGWINYSGSYSGDALDEIAQVRFVVAGQDKGYWGGYYGTQFRNAQLTFEYNPVEESLIIEVEQEIFDLLDDLEHGLIGFDEFNDELITIQYDLTMDIEENQGDFDEFDSHDLETPTLADEMLVEVADEIIIEVEDIKEDVKLDTKLEVETKGVKREQSNSKKHNKSSNSSSNPNSTQYDFPTDGSFTPNTSNVDGLKELQLLQQINEVNTVASSYTDTIDLDSYTSISMADSVELEDNEDWYQNQAFYKSVGMSDSGILNGYNNVKLKDNKEWYGSNPKFY